MRAFGFVVLVLVASLSCSGPGGGGDSGPATDIPEVSCVTNCVGKQCGDDGCGGSCGTCSNGAICNSFMGQCIGGCVPDCQWKECGDNGCGGSCGSCLPGSVCNTKLFKCDANCQPDCAGKQCGDDGCEGSCGTCPADTICEAGQCTGGQSCKDGGKNGTETDVDCGGACPPCGLGKACLQPNDCTSKVCQNGFCGAAPTCDDYAKNGNETDVDCGGMDCAPCGVGKACFVPGDCVSGICQQGVCGAPASCNDGSKNGTETDVDCGGGACPACALTKFCNQHTDCLSLNCYYGVCAEPTCEDGSKNQDESDVDCGGKCPGCNDGKKCGKDGDCQSGRCEAGSCVSCGDGLKNNGESDTDCGGPNCPKCANGKKCQGPSDCSSGACEGGTCCSPNACGECTTTPDEVCDGKDNDCDGKTDEKPDIGAAPKCPKQAGVCAGSWAACEGTKGWNCDTAVYFIHDDAYQENETKCDGKDNDCNGQTDEGLLNPCGWCGTTPVEICNGLDDDCNGQTDEPAMCASCEASPTPVKLDQVSSSWGFQMSWKNWLAMLDNSAYLLFGHRGYYETKYHLVRCTDGAEKNDWTPGLPDTGNNTITSGGGKLHLGTAGIHNTGGVGTHKVQYYRFTASGTMDKHDVIGSCSNISGQPAVVSWAQNTAWIAYWQWKDTDSQYETVTKLGSDQWEYTGTYFADDDYGTQFVVDELGKWHTAYIDSPWDDKNVYYQVQDGSAFTLCSNNDCGSPALRIGPGGDLHVVYSESGQVKYRKKSGASWGSPQTVDTGFGGNLAFGPGGNPVVSYARTEKELWVAVAGAGGGWTTDKIYTVPEALEFLSGTAVGVDGIGRIHIGMRTSTTDGYYAKDQLIYYVMFCPQGDSTCVPDCAGLVCGNDGCGGLCGTCGAGEECVDGQCDANAGCGPAGSYSCMGQCGGNAGGCYCDTACTGAGDCCADYLACCPPA